MKWKIKYKRTYLILLLPLALILTVVAKNSRAFMDSYLHFYKAISQILGNISGLFPILIHEVIIIALLIGIIILIVQMIRRKKTVRKTFKKSFISILAIVSTMYFIFTVNCGLNYYQRSFVDYTNMTVSTYTKEKLASVCDVLLKKTNELAAVIPRKNDGNIDVMSFYSTAEQAQKTMSKLSNDYKILSGIYPKPKPALFSQFMSMAKITGMYAPFTIEAIVNSNIPPTEIPVTMCHELSHLSGFMREDEANFIAYLACSVSDEIYFQYSGYMLALNYCMNALAAADYDTFSLVAEQYSEPLYNDLLLSINYWKQFDTPVAKVSNAINDTYLKVNSQTDGTKSYGRVVDLILAKYLEDAHI